MSKLSTDASGCPRYFVVCELGPITFEGPRWQDYLMNPFLLSL